MLRGIPLILATGAGAVSRFDIGIVIATGMSVGTLFTLFVPPCIYTLVARPDAPPGVTQAANATLIGNGGQRQQRCPPALSPIHGPLGRDPMSAGGRLR